MTAKSKAIAIGSISTLAAITASTPEFIIRTLMGALFTRPEVEELIAALHATPNELSETILSEMIDSAKRDL